MLGRIGLGQTDDQNNLTASIDLSNDELVAAAVQREIVENVEGEQATAMLRKNAWKPLSVTAIGLGLLWAYTKWKGIK